MIDSRKMVEDVEIGFLRAAFIAAIAMVIISYEPSVEPYDLNDLGNCLEEWDQAIKDDWNPDFYEDACNAIKEQLQ